MVKKVKKSESSWREELSAEAFQVLREKGTERPFSGELCDTFTPGTYVCAGCGMGLFESAAKFDAGCGWPSFSESANPDVVATAVDASHGRVRTEILCAACDGHLGHVFDDGPTETGLRYCVNSLAIKLEPTDT